MAKVIASAPVRVITAHEAVAMGWTPSQIKTIARSLDRIARMHVQHDVKYKKNRRGEEATDKVFGLINFDSAQNNANAREFRLLAKMMELGEKK